MWVKLHGVFIGEVEDLVLVRHTCRTFDCIFCLRFYAIACGGEQDAVAIYATISKARECQCLNSLVWANLQHVETYNEDNLLM